MLEPVCPGEWSRHISLSMLIIGFYNHQISHLADILIIKGRIIHRNTDDYGEIILVKRFDESEKPRGVYITVNRQSIFDIYMYPFYRAIFYMLFKSIDETYSFLSYFEQVRKMHHRSGGICIGKTGNGEDVIFVQNLKSIPIDGFIHTTSGRAKGKPVWKNDIKLFYIWCHGFFGNGIVLEYKSRREKRFGRKWRKHFYCLNAHIDRFLIWIFSGSIFRRSIVKRKSFQACLFLDFFECFFIGNDSFFDASRIDKCSCTNRCWSRCCEIQSKSDGEEKNSEH